MLCCGPQIDDIEGEKLTLQQRRQELTRQMDKLAKEVSKSNGY